MFEHAPEIVFYLAGADPYRDDQLGGSGAQQSWPARARSDGLPRVRNQEVPVVVVLAGGYARKVEDTVDIHAATIDEALT